MKKRIIPSILLKNGSSVCLSRGFSPWRTIGALTQVLRLHVQRGADELLVINLDSAGIDDCLPSDRIFRIIRNEVNIPISYVGGISSPDAAIKCINSGFDKVYLTSTFLDDPQKVKAISNIIGSQSLGVCLPFRQYAFGYKVWDYRFRQPSKIVLSDAIDMAITYGAGELLLYDCLADGSLEGLDMSLYRELNLDQVTVPVLHAGGAGTQEHFSSVLQNPFIHGVVAGSIFALTDATPLTIRHHCLSSGIPMRRP